MNSTLMFLIVGLTLVIALTATPAFATEPLDLSHATVVNAAPHHPVIAKATAMLRDEIAKRTGLELASASTLPKDGPVILIALSDAFSKNLGELPAGLAVPEKAEGYAIWVDTAKRNAPTVYLVGRDDRGALFAAGRLLRLLDLRPHAITLAPDTRLATAPAQPIRGQQLGYRNTNNTIDAWNVAQFEQYIRDLIVFGNNAIELIPDFSEKASPHMIMPAMEMNAKLSRLIASYGLDVWIWQTIDGNVTDPAIAKKEMKRCERVFKALPHIDDVFIPGGDPGDTPPEGLLPFLAKLVKVLHQTHPKAKLWFSNQGFKIKDNDFMYNYLNKEKPTWLTGLVYGPWTKQTLKDMRERTPKQYPIRSYPDITHNVRCQFPVPHWDRAFAHTIGREGCNPRPVAEAHIHNSEIPYCQGFIAYSDGVHDDVNKIIWSACAWDPNVKVKDVLRDYGRYFIGEDLGPAVAKGILDLEQDWKGPLKDNQTVDNTFKYWQGLEQKASARVKANWRFQQLLMRAYYDEYDKQRLDIESQREAAAYDALKKAPFMGPAAAIGVAQLDLVPNDAPPEAPKLRKRIRQLGADLFKSIGAQLSVKPPFLASGAERGAILDFLDQPLNDAPWLFEQFAHILKETSLAQQLADIATLVNWETPPPGSFYDDLGNATKEPHLVYQKTWAQDPGFVESPQDEFSGDPNVPQDQNLGDPTRVKNKNAVRLSWLDQAQTLYDTPLRMHYDHLDPDATYKLRITYAGRFRAKMILTANGKYRIHGPTGAQNPIAPQDFPVPKAATKTGVLNLRWDKTQGRGCQVAEVWLLKQSKP